MSGTEDFIVYDGERYAVRNVGRGPAQPLVPRIATGSRAFTGGTPPFESQGQRAWNGGMLLRDAKDEDNIGFWGSLNVTVKDLDRIELANAWTSTLTSDVTELCLVVYKTEIFAYSVGSNKIYKSTDGTSFSAVDLSGIVWTGTNPTGWNCAIVAPTTSASETQYLLFGSNKGHLLRYDGTNWAQEARVVDASDSEINFHNGIMCMEMYQGILWIGGQDDDNEALVATYDSSTADDLAKQFAATSLRGSRFVSWLQRFYVEGNENPDQIHIFLAREQSNQIMGQHFMYDGTEFHELKTWPDNYVIRALPFDGGGSRALYLTMRKYGSIEKFAGDYVEVVRLDVPERSFPDWISSLWQFGRFLIFPIMDATNGLSLGYYDGSQAWQGPSVGSSFLQQCGWASGLTVFNGKVYMTHKATNAARVFYLDNSTSLQTTGQLDTSEYSAFFRETPKEWLRALVTHEPLRTGESVELQYRLEGSAFGGGGSVQTRQQTLDLGDASFEDVGGTTGIWDTEAEVWTNSQSAEANFVGKIAGSTVANPHVAYTLIDKAPASRSVQFLVQIGTEMVQNDYDLVEADDLSHTTTVTTTGTLDQSSTATEVGEDRTISSSQAYGQEIESGDTDTFRGVTVKAKVASGSGVIKAQFRRRSTWALRAVSQPVTVSDTSYTETHLPFTAGIDITAGTEYVICIVWQSGSTVQLQGAQSNDYPAGQAFDLSADGATITKAHDQETIWFKTYTGGSTGRPSHLYAFDLSDEVPANLIPTVIGFATDTTGSANAGTTLAIWNHADGAWETVDTHAATSADNDAGKTLTGTLSDPTEYLGSDGRVYLLMYGDYFGTALLAARMRVDFVKLGATVAGALQTVRTKKLNVGDGTITKATLTKTDNALGTRSYYLSADGGTNWEATTPGSELTFSNTGTDLRIRADLTPSGANVPSVSALAIQYTVSASWTSLGTSSLIGSTEKYFPFPDPTYSKLIAFRIKLAGSGSTSPSVRSLRIEFLHSPDVVEAFSCELVLRGNQQYHDGVVETRTPKEQYDDLIALRRSRRRPELTWVDGDVIESATFQLGHWKSRQAGLGTVLDDERVDLVPLVFIEVPQ